MSRKGDWIQTYSGGQFWVMDPDPGDVSIEVIAHALSNLCRFGGHCERFYSVAEHSVHVSSVATMNLVLIGLLHDASEAYLCDIPRPIKRFLPDYRDAEKKVETAIYRYFGIPEHWIARYRAELKRIDMAVLTAEARKLMKPPPVKWVTDCEPAEISIRCWTPEEARYHFLQKFNEVHPWAESYYRTEDA